MVKRRSDLQINNFLRNPEENSKMKITGLPTGLNLNRVNDSSDEFRRIMQVYNFKPRLIDIICPHRLRNNCNTKKIKKANLIFKSTLSYENLFKVIMQFENLKRYSMNDNDLYLLENLPLNDKKIFKKDATDYDKLFTILTEVLQLPNDAINRLLNLNFN
jgi:hypothetical protein